MKRKIIVCTILCCLSGALFAQDKSRIGIYHSDVDQYHGDRSRQATVQVSRKKNQLSQQSNRRGGANQENRSRRPYIQGDHRQDSDYRQTYHRRTYRQADTTYQETYHRESHYERSYRQGRVGQRYW